MNDPVNTIGYIIAPFLACFIACAFPICIWVILDIVSGQDPAEGHGTLNVMFNTKRDKK